MDPSQTPNSPSGPDNVNDLLCEATKNAHLEEVLALYESELKDQKSLSTGLRTEFEEASQTFKATYGRNKALLSLLSHNRKLFRDAAKSLADLRVLNRAMCDTGRYMSALQSSNETLYQEIDAQKRRADDYFTVLNKIIKESKQMNPSPAGSSSTDPDNLLLRSWHAEEASLRQEVIELNAEATIQARLQAKAREESVHRRLSEAVAKEYDIGYAEGYARGRAEAVRNSVALDDIEAQLDNFLKEDITALDGSDIGVREKMLESFQAALSVPRHRDHFA